MEAVTKKPNVPALRFPEFNGEWQGTRLGKEIDSYSGGTPSSSKPEYYNGVIQFIQSGEIESVRSTKCISELGLKNSSAKMVRRGDLLLALYGATAGVSGFTSRDGAINQALLCIRSNSINLYFLNNWFQREKTRILSKYLQGGQGNLSSGIIHSLRFSAPRMEEQEKVAAFLTVVDERFGLLKRKKELLEEYKKGVMQRLFSREIRFKDEEGNEYPEWEEKRLGEVVDEFMVPMRDKPENLTGPIPWCRIEDFDGIYLSRSKSGQGVDEKTIDAMNLVVFPENSLIVSCSANLGFAAIVATPLVTNQTFIGLVPNPQLLDVKFFYYMMTRAARELNVLASGTTIKYLSKDGFKKFKRALPSIREQEAIAGCLLDVDLLISCIVKQIQQLQGFKEGLLQKMFV